jgi:hypothetical protein
MRVRGRDDHVRLGNADCLRRFDPGPRLQILSTT